MSNMPFIEIRNEVRNTAIIEPQLELESFDEEKTVNIDGEDLILVKRSTREKTTQKIVGYNSTPIKVVGLYWPANEEGVSRRETIDVSNFSTLVSYVGLEKALEIAEQAEWEAPL